MKKFITYLPHIVFAALMIGFGALGKLVGAEPAVEMFSAINLFDKGEALGRILVGLGELGAGIGIFFAATRKISAVLGMAMMAGAMIFVVNGTIGGSVVLPALTFALALYLFVKSTCGCKTAACKGGTC